VVWGHGTELHRKLNTKENYLKSLTRKIMARLNNNRQEKLEPKRLRHAVDKIIELGYTVEIDEKKISFEFKGEKVTLFPYSGWHTGKSIKDGRGLENLINQIKNKL
jgi:hypothetical protein